MVAIRTQVRSIDYKTYLQTGNFNNEIGSIEPVSELAAAAKKVNPHLVFHSDCVQAFGKIPLHAGRTGIDLISISTHKLHGSAMNHPDDVELLAEGLAAAVS